MSTERPSGAARFTGGVGWLAVVLSLAGSCFSASVGINNALLKEWWAPSVVRNVEMVAVYLVPSFILVVFALVAVGWPRIGGLLHLVVGGIVFGFPFIALADAGYLSNPNNPHLDPFLLMHLVGALLAVVGIGYLKGRPKPKWLAAGLVLGLPLAVCIVTAVEPIWRISHRQDDGITTARHVKGNGVELVWAPAGPGWPENGEVTFTEAEQIVSCLTEDGRKLADSPQNIWRLPTVDEVVRSLTRYGKNAGGEWDSNKGTKYRVTPDKESPLWHVHSPVVYWWTSSRVPDRRDGKLNYIASYRGDVSKHYTFLSSDGLGFRAVKGR